MKKKVKEEPKKEAMRFSDNKLRFDLIPAEVLIELARVYTIGGVKYDDNNWRKGMKYSKVLGSLQRHLILFICGFDRDPDTKCHNLAQVIWNAATLLVYRLRGLGTDDRIKYDIDENFDLVHNPMQLGMSKEELAELRKKYQQEREKHK